MLTNCVSGLRTAFISGFANGRLYPYLSSALQARGVEVFNSSHMAQNSSMRSMIDFLNTNKVQCVINQAALWEGPKHFIWNVNYKQATELAAASKIANCKFIQISTVTALQKGITFEEHPYAYSKRQTNEYVKGLPHVTICHLGPLLGENKSLKSNISFLAGIPSCLPYTIHLDVKQQTIQPTSYEEAAQAITHLALASFENRFIPKEVNIVGDPILLDSFLRAINPSAWFEIHIKNPKDFLDLAAAVDNGINTPEFIKLLMLAQENEPPILPNDAYRLFLGDRQLRNTSELARYTAEQSSLRQQATHVLSLMKNNGLRMLYEAVKVSYKVKIQLSPSFKKIPAASLQL